MGTESVLVPALYAGFETVGLLWSLRSLRPRLDCLPTGLPGGRLLPEKEIEQFIERFAKLKQAFEKFAGVYREAREQLEAARPKSQRRQIIEMFGNSAYYAIDVVHLVVPDFLSWVDARKISPETLDLWMDWLHRLIPDYNSANRAFLMVRAECEDALQTLGEPGIKGVPNYLPERPATILASWRDILIALEMNYNTEDKQKVSRLNKSYDGPIISSGQGKQPIVDKARLLEWWNRLTIDLQDKVNQAKGAVADSENQHNYGKTGKAAPDIGGEVKARRKDRRP